MSGNLRLSRIVANLRRHVPPPPAPIARPTGSFAGLRPGQRITIPGKAGDTIWQIAGVDSLGADLVTEGDKMRITDRDFIKACKRVRAPRKRATPS